MAGFFRFSPHERLRYRSANYLASGAERALAYKDPIMTSLGTAAVILVVSRTAEHPSALMVKRFYISLGHIIAVVCEIPIVRS